MESLSPKVIHSGFWILGGNWLSRGLGIIKIIILARLLSPLDFGILGLAILSINVLKVFSETGIESALIQRDKIGRAELDTAWTIAVIKGMFLFLLLFLSSGWFAQYFDNAALKPILKVMAIVLILEGFTNIGIIFFQKELELKKKVLLESASDITGAIATILLAFWLKNVWALVLGSIVWGIIKCLGSYILHSYRPRIYWNWPITKSLLTFGKHIFWIGIMTFIITSLDDALVGKLLGLTMLGFYTMAFNIASFPVSSLTGALSQVFFPAYSAIQNDSKRIEKAFLRAFDAAVIILLPLTSMMVILAPSFTTIFLGKKWLPMVPTLQVLCVFGLFRGISALYYPLHLALKPDIQSKIKTLALVIFLIIVYPLTVKWGILGTGYAMTVVYLINMLMGTILTVRLVPLDWRKLASSILTPLFTSFMIIITAIIIQFLEFPVGKFTNFIFLSASCLGIGIILTVIFQRKFLNDFIEDMRNFSQ